MADLFLDFGKKSRLKLLLSRAGGKMEVINYKKIICKIKIYILKCGCASEWRKTENMADSPIDFA